MPALSEPPPAAERPADSDAALLDRYVRGRDADAFGELVRRFGPMVRAVAMRTVSHREDAEDVTQVVFTELARRAGTVEDAAALGGWLHTITVRTALKLRKRRRAGRELTDETTPTRTADPLAAISRRADLATLSEELDELPADWREPLLLRYFAGCDTATAAARMGLSVEAFKGRIKRGKNTLRVRLLRRGVGVTGVLAAALSGVEAEAGLPFEEAEALWSAAADASLELSGEADITPLDLTETTMPPSVLSLKAVLAAALVAMLSLSGGVGGQGPTRTAAAVQTVAETPPETPVAAFDATVGDEVASDEVTVTVYEVFDLPAEVVDSLFSAFDNDVVRRVEGREAVYVVRLPEDGHAALEEAIETVRADLRSDDANVASEPARPAGKTYDIEPWMIAGLAEFLAEWETEADGRTFEVNDEATRITLRSRSSPFDPSVVSRLQVNIDRLRTGKELAEAEEAQRRRLQRMEAELGSDHPRVAAERSINAARSEARRERNELQYFEYTLARMQEAGAATPAASPEADDIASRPDATPVSVAMTGAEANVERALEKQNSVEYVDTALQNALDYLADVNGVPIRIDRRALEEDGLSGEEEFSLILADVTLRTLLTQILLQEIGGLDFYARDGVIHVTTQTEAAEHRFTRAYPVPEGMTAADVTDMITTHNLTSPRGDIFFDVNGGDGAATAVGQFVVITHSDRGHEAVERFLKAIQDVTGEASRPVPPAGGGGIGGGGFG